MQVRKCEGNMSRALILSCNALRCPRSGQLVNGDLKRHGGAVNIGIGGPINILRRRILSGRAYHDSDRSNQV